MIDLFGEITGRVPSCELIEIDGSEFYGDGYEDSTRVLPDISKARSLGWEPALDLESTLRESMRSMIGDAGV